MDFPTPKSDNTFTSKILADTPTALLTVQSPWYPVEFLGLYFGNVVGESSYTVAAVITPASTAGAIAAIGFTEEPG